jgi:Ca2+-transporting ATPase
MEKNLNWHNLSWQEVVEKMNSDAKSGLPEEQIEIRQKKFGLNKFPEKKSLSGFKLFLEQFKSPLIYILLLVAGVVLILESYPYNLIQSGFVLAAVLINAIFGFWEEKKASKTLEELKKILKTKTVVIRDGRKKEVLQEEVVPGDIISFSSGDKIPADGRLIEAQDLKISEAVLTGEWLPASKKEEILPSDTPLADRDNMVYSGCLVESGKGKAVVTATGLKTEMGKIATLVKETKEEKTPLQKKLSRFSKVIGIVIGAMTIFIFIGGVLREKDPIEMFETAAAVAVGGIPEALPVVMTLILALGMGRLARKKGLVRKLASVETLGSTSIICTDKTKTLTQGKMRAAELLTLEEDFKIDPEIKNSVYIKALEIATLGNEAFIENPEKNWQEWKIGGTPTDKALLLAGARSGILRPELEKENPILQTLPFDPAKKYEAALIKKGKDHFLYISGAPEKIIELSTKVEEGNGQKELDQEKLTLLYSKLHSLTEKGRRVIALAYKKPTVHTQDHNLAEEEIKELVFVGFIGLKDPLRPDVREAFVTCRKAGLNVVIITGDHKITAKAVAEELELDVKDENIIDGKELDLLSDEELEKKVKEIKIYARAEPRHKIRIIQAWQQEDKVVAMTGDGVNDAPALQKADIGLALGSGTEVVKEAADLVLLNDSFHIIVRAVEEGRVILDNLRKSIAFLLSNSFAGVILVGMSVILGWPLPILWMQLLWNNLVEDTLPAIAYGFEPKEKGVMERGPASPKASLLTREMKTLIFGVGIVRQFLILGLFWFLWQQLGFSLDYVRTMVFGAIVIDTAFVIYSFKNMRRNVWRINILDNKFLLLGSAVIFGAFAAAVYFGPFQTLLQTVPLGIYSWLILIGIALLSVGLIELTKWFFISHHLTEE